MVDIVVTPASVIATGNVSREDGQAGETIPQGKAVYFDTTLGKWKLADNDSVTVEARQAVGISLNSASLDQPIAVANAGDIALGGAVLVAGSPYYVSATPGGIAPQADIVAGKTVCLLGIARSTTVLALDIQFPGVTL